MVYLRPAAVAGTWYPATRGRAHPRGGRVSRAPSGRDSARAGSTRSSRRTPASCSPARLRRYAYQAAAAHGPFDAVHPRRPVALRRLRRRRALSVRRLRVVRSVPRSIDERLGAELLAASPRDSVRCPPRTRASTRSRCSCRSSGACCPDRRHRPAAHGLPDARDTSSLADALAHVAADRRTGGSCSSPAPICRTTSTRRRPRRSTGACRTVWRRSIPTGCCALRGVPGGGARALRRVRRRADRSR